MLVEDLEFIFQKKVEEIITINIWIRNNENNNYDVLSIYCEILLLTPLHELSH